MFKNAGYVCKHIANKHPELIPEEFTYEVGLIGLLLEKTFLNNFVPSSSNFTTTLRWTPTVSRCLPSTLLLLGQAVMLVMLRGVSLLLAGRLLTTSRLHGGAPLLLGLSSIPERDRA
jgi:hypothetical protein